MNRFYKKTFVFCLLVLCGLSTFTSVLGQEQENIPISSQLGQSLKGFALAGKKVLDKDDLELAFSIVDERRNENDPAYALLRMTMDRVNKNPRKVLLANGEYKGSGTVLYRAGDYILVLTARHNLYQEVSNIETLEIAEMRLMLDNKDQKNKDVILAKMVGNNYIQVAQKDIALVAMRLNDDIFEKDKPIFDILDFKNTQQQGKGNSVNAVISQYPSYFDWYIKVSGLAYHENGKGYHYAPTLPGSSGSPVIVGGKIAGVHVSSGQRLPPMEPNIIYNNNMILIENNLFELISSDEIKQEGANLKNSKDKVILADLIQKYIDALDKSKDNVILPPHREEL